MRFGDLDRSGDRWTLRFTRRLRHPPETVWRAVTEPDQLQAWFPDRLVGDLTAVGSALRFEPAGGEFPGFDGEVLACRPGSLIEFRWGEDTIRLEIRAEGTGCTLTLTDTFAELGKAARDAAGWHVCLDALEAAIDGIPQTGPSMRRWLEVHPGYVTRLGPEASSIGPPEEMLEAARRSAG